MRNTKLCLMLAPLILITGLQQIVYGCICRSNILPCEEYQAAEVVFVGTVLSVSLPTWKRTEQTQLYLPGVVTWQVRSVFKGELSGVLTLSQGMSGDCLPHFQRGETWLVYASRDAQAPAAGLLPRACSRHALLREAAADIAYLEKITAMAGGTRLQGSLRYDGSAPFLSSATLPSLAGISVVIRQGESVYETFTDETGVYEISGLGAGKYEVAPQFPTVLGHARGHPPTTITIQQSSCSCLDFVVKPRNE